jgi:hypothetical protein
MNFGSKNKWNNIMIAITDRMLYIGTAGGAIQVAAEVLEKCKLEGTSIS